MVASIKTLEEVKRILLKHVHVETALQITEELTKVEGNESFRLSMFHLNSLMKLEKR